MAGDPPEVGYGIDECGNCHAELDNGRHICMSNFTVPSAEPIRMSICRNGVWFAIELRPGDVIEYGWLEMSDDEDE